MQTDSLSSSELANLRLPNLQVSRQAIEKRAKTQGWPYIEEVGKARGGRLKKYLIASLPAEIRAAIMKRQSDELAEKMPKTLPQVRPGTAMSAPLMTTLILGNYLRISVSLNLNWLIRSEEIKLVKPVENWSYVIGKIKSDGSVAFLVSHHPI